MRFLLVFLAASLLAQPPCHSELIRRWNRFAEDANRYTENLNGNVLDLKARTRLEKDWQAVVKCECW